MSITAPPTVPQITDPSTFATRAQDWVVWQANQLYPALIEESLLLGLSLSGTSVTSNTIGTGSKSFITQTGLGFKAGQSLSIARTSAPTNRMFVVVDSYDSGTGALVVTSQAFEGSGTFTDWSIALAFNGVISASQLSDGSVTFAKIQNIATSRLLGRSTASSGDIEELSIASNLSLTAGVLKSEPTLGTPVTLTNQTAVDFSIPSWAKNFALLFSNVSGSGTSNILTQLSDAGGFETTSYSSATVQVQGGSSQIGTASSAGFLITASNSAASVYNGIVEFKNITGNSYIESGCLYNTVGAINVSAGNKTLSHTITQVRVTFVNGTDQFDAGTLNYMYW